jgi:ribonuclease-3
VLGLVIADWLSRAFPMTGEEGLAPRLNALVNRTTCAQIGARLGLSDFMRLAKSEQQSGGRGRETVLADACEAVIAAIYLDGGLEAARALIEREWAEAFASVEVAPVDPKTALQEWAAARRMGLPDYHVIGRSGPDHAPLFRVRVAIAGLGEAEGEGGAKRDAERAAARALMAQVQHDG